MNEQAREMLGGHVSKIGPAMRQQASKQLHYKFCPSPRADALQVFGSL